MCRSVCFSISTKLGNLKIKYRKDHGHELFVQYCVTWEFVQIKYLCPIQFSIYISSFHVILSFVEDYENSLCSPSKLILWQSALMCFIRGIVSIVNWRVWVYEIHDTLLWFHLMGELFICLGPDSDGVQFLSSNWYWYCHFSLVCLLIWPSCSLKH